MFFEQDVEQSTLVERESLIEGEEIIFWSNELPSFVELNEENLFTSTSTMSLPQLEDMDYHDDLLVVDTADEEVSSQNVEVGKGLVEDFAELQR